MNNLCKCLAPCLPGRFPGKQSLRQSWGLLEATSGIKTWGRAGKGREGMERERKGRERKVSRVEQKEKLGHEKVSVETLANPMGILKLA